MKIAILAGLTSLLVSIPSQAREAVQWRWEDGGNGHWYLVELRSNSQWPYALEREAALGGYLVSITTPSEWAFVRDLAIASHPASVSSLWLMTGGVRPEGASEWHWRSGEPWGFTAWGGNGCPSGPYPNNDVPGAAVGIVTGQICAGASQAVWDDFLATSTGGNSLDGLIVEWSADCNNDGIIDYGQCRDGSLPDANGNNIPDCCEAGVPCVVNMLANGSFELGPQQSCGWICITPGDNRLVGWEVTLNSVDRERTEPNGCNENWFASHGNYSIDMNGCSVGGAIRQRVATVVGKRYELSFDMTLNPPNVAVGRLRAAAGDTSVVFEYVRRPTNPQPSEHHSMQFTAVSSMTDVTFESLNREYPGQWNGPVVDSARVVPVVPDSPTCVDADIFRDFNVNGADLGILLSQWGPNTPLTRSDLNLDGVVDGIDLGIFLSFWGPCP